MRTLLPKLFVSLLFWFSASLMAAESPVYTGFLGNKAVGGYDTVAYFTESKPVKGNKKFSTEYEGARWFFSSKQNLELFKANPEKYAPQYGGYCAWAVAHGYTASTDPKAWKIVNGKLYLNYSQTVKRSWEMDIPRYIAQGDSNWPRVLQ